MTKNELMEIVKAAGFGNYAYEAAGMFQELTNAILERAAVKFHDDDDWNESRYTGHAVSEKIRSLKLPTN